MHYTLYLPCELRDYQKWLEWAQSPHCIQFDLCFTLFFLAFILVCWHVCVALQLHCQISHWRWVFNGTALNYYGVLQAVMIKNEWTMWGVGANTCWIAVSSFEIMSNYCKRESRDVCATTPEQSSHSSLWGGAVVGRRKQGMSVVNGYVVQHRFNAETSNQAALGHF